MVGCGQTFFDPQNRGPMAVGWSNWFPLGDGLFFRGTPISAVSCVTRGTQIFALGEDCRVWTTFFYLVNLGPMADGWSNWFPLGDGLFFQGTPISAISGVTRGTQVFVLGEDNRVWTAFFGFRRISARWPAAGRTGFRWAMDSSSAVPRSRGEQCDAR